MRLVDADALLANRQILRGEDVIGIRDYVTVAEIENAPTIEPERETGEWVVYTDGMLHCSNCSEIPVNRIIFQSTLVYNTDISGVMKFCPNCGARMMISKEGGSNG